jgi:hypothetical protein
MPNDTQKPKLPVEKTFPLDRKPRKPPVKDEMGNVLSIAVKPIVTGFTIRCPKCRNNQLVKLSGYESSVEVTVFTCEKCQFTHTLDKPLKVGGTKRVYL